MTTFRDRLASGKPQLGLGIMYPAPGIVERIGPDWDWVWVDGQHGQIGYQEILAMVRACDLMQRPAFVRVPWNDVAAISLTLDTAAPGVIVPCVDTAAEAQQAVDAVRFPPLGRRSYGGRRPIDLYGRGFSHDPDREPILIVQIESPEAIEDVEAIAAVDGIDGLFLGPDDVLLRRGHRMDIPATVDDLEADLTAVSTACRNHGRIAVTVGRHPEIFNLCLALDYRMIVAGGDVPILAAGSKEWAEEARGRIDAFAAPDQA